MSQIHSQWFAEQEDKTEEPSEERLRRLREDEGEVPKSNELTQAIVFLAVVIMLVVLAPLYLRLLQETWIFFFTNPQDEPVNQGRYYGIFLRNILITVLPIAVVGGIFGFLANVIQNRGFLFVPKRIQPKLDKLIPKPFQWLKNTIFSARGGFNIVKSILKLIILALTAFLIIRAYIPRILEMLHPYSISASIRQLGRIVSILLIVSAVILLVISILDYIVSRREFMKQNRMTKQEVKEEFKEMEGDPEIKARIDQEGRALLARNLPRIIREADVVITNPTHYAVSLQWRSEISTEPEVTAKGEDMTAQTMKKLARDNDVPIYEDRVLARTLYADTEVGQSIPDYCIRPIVEVYRRINYMERQQQKKEKRQKSSTAEK